MTRILLVDDFPVVRAGLKDILRDAIAGAAFGDAESGGEALEAVRDGDWDIVILDISLPDKSGLDVLKELRREVPRLPVLVLSMYPEEQFAVRALRAGAAGYVTKQTAASDLVTAVRKVLAGSRYVSPALAEKLATHVRLPPAGTPHELLSDREFQVFRLLGSGKTVTAIAEELQLSVATVSTYRSRILEKMGMTDKADLVQYARVNQILE